MKRIKLTKGYYALVDDQDFDILNTYHWRIKINKHTKYAFTGIISIGMHRLVLNAKKGKW